MAGSILGAAVKRAEDPRFVRGRGTFIPNQVVEGALSMVPIRSQIAHGRIVSIDTSFALPMPGVVGVYTAVDIDLPVSAPGATGVPGAFGRPPIAIDTVRFAGEIVALVVAETERQAVDAASAVYVDIDPLPVITDPVAALQPDAPLLFPEAGTNVCLSGGDEPDPGFFDGCEVRVTANIVNQRVAAVPLETGSALAVPDGDRLHLSVGSQNVFSHRNAISRATGFDRDRLHAMVPDMGGGFGAKFYVYPEQTLTAKLAIDLGRPVRWHESRRDNLVAMTQGRGQRIEVELGADASGRVLAIRMRILQEAGAYPLFGAYLPTWTRLMATGVYAIERLEGSWQSVVTNTTPIHAYRGAGRPEATHAIERAMDVLAAQLGIDPVELRRRNYLDPGVFPYTTPSGAVYDSGDYQRNLDTALDLAGYGRLRTEQSRRRADGDPVRLGIGVATYVEITAGDDQKEWAGVEVHDDGSATARVGTSGHGQGHETAFAQLLCGLTGIPMERISVLQADSDIIARGWGTGASRSLQLGGTAVMEAGGQVLAKARRIVADHLEAAVEDIVVLPDERLGVSGVPAAALTWAEVARIAAELPDDPGLAAELIHDQGHATFPFGTHVSVVEVDTVTGTVRLVRHIAVDDCGVVLNPLLVAGQVHGGFAQGAGQALWEQVLYDEDGNPLTGSLVSYLIPTAASLPFVERGVTVTPTPYNALGVKGIGEAATIGSTPAIHNAVIDALSDLGITHIDMPLTGHRVWEALRSARPG
ncbi:MAG: xanthine dehydrogenase family protein molybdopterin-binding subunit [Acidimicrobiia bacterium]